MFGARVDDEMELLKDRTVRFYPDEKQNLGKPSYQFSGPGAPATSIFGAGSSLKLETFAEDHEPWRKHILDPGSDTILKWNRVFLVSCLFALVIDPLYFYLPATEIGARTMCVKTDEKLGIVVTILRTIADLFYILHIAIKFRTAYVAPSTTVFGRGELVMDPKRISRRYLKSDFFVDLIAALPLPQIVIWLVLARNSGAYHNNYALALIVLIQYIPRLYVIFPLSCKIIKADGVVTKTAWAGAAYNLLLYMIASHVLGASWYLLSIERQTTCWMSQCKLENGTNTPFCDSKYLECKTFNQSDRDRQNWSQVTNIFIKCKPAKDQIHQNTFNYGIFNAALLNDAHAINFLKKYVYCLWWGLQNLSCYGQTLQTSTYVGETLFAILIAILGLVLFAHLIGNMQTYLQSITVRLEEWRLKRRDTEEWMQHRQLPHYLRERIRRFVQYKWMATRGVDEESILKALPADLRRDIQRHLCLGLVRRVHFFSQMDDQLLDAICDGLVSSLSTEGTYIVREGDPVTEMLFIIRGRLESSTTNGGRTGFFNSTILRPGDFCGEELLGWALLPKSTLNLPSSTRTVRTLDEVEAFALRPENLKFVANQFRRLHSKKLQHTLRFYSQQWRTWSACFIQAAWHRYKRRQTLKESLRDSFNTRTADLLTYESGQEEEHSQTHCRQNSDITTLNKIFVAHTRKGSHKLKDIDISKLQKPEEPDFSTCSYD